MQPSPNLQVTLFQAAVHPLGPEAALSHFEEKIWQHNQSTSLIVLPEMFASGYTMQAQQYAQHSNMGIFRWMRQMAGQTGAVICGTMALQEGNLYYNRLIWMRPDGSYAYYNKKHLFSFAHENEVYRPGYQRIIVNLKGWNFCPLICYDLRFPVWSRNRLNEYDVLLYTAAWPEARINAWKALLPARAIENQSYCLGINATGTFEGTLYGGHSMALDAKGENLAQSGTEEALITLTLQYETLQKFRSKFPVYSDADVFSLEGLNEP
jgi:omega-amidase